jgi:hypothetical protein
MKESAKILTVIMVIIFGFAFIANNSSNNQEEQVQIIPCEKGLVKLVYLKRSEAAVKVSVLNKAGEIIFYEEVSAERGFVNVYDLHTFGSGDYIFRIADSKGEVDHEVYFKESKNMVFCEMGNTGKYRLVMEDAKDLDINVFNEDHQLLLSENISSRESINKLFDLSRIVGHDNQDQISFIIKSDNELFKIATF